MDRKFKCDIDSLIEAVGCNPCIWDKSIKQYKDIILRKNAWLDVCRILEPEFDRFENESQEEIITNIMNKWTHVRDSFKRSLRTKNGQRAKRKYVYAEALQFLLKNMPAGETESSIQSTKDEETDVEQDYEPSALTLHTSIAKRMKINPLDKEIPNSVPSKQPRPKEEQIDEDHAFLLSLLPTIKKIPEDDKMDFRIEVMQLVSKYTKQNKFI